MDKFFKYVEKVTSIALKILGVVFILYGIGFIFYNPVTFVSTNDLSLPLIILGIFSIRESKRNKSVNKEGR